MNMSRKALTTRQLKAAEKNTQFLSSMGAPIRVMESSVPSNTPPSILKENPTYSSCDSGGLNVHWPDQGPVRAELIRLKIIDKFGYYCGTKIRYPNAAYEREMDEFYDDDDESYDSVDFVSDEEPEEVAQTFPPSVSKEIVLATPVVPLAPVVVAAEQTVIVYPKLRFNGIHIVINNYTTEDVHDVLQTIQSNEPLPAYAVFGFEGKPQDPAIYDHTPFEGMFPMPGHILSVNHPHIHVYMRWQNVRSVQSIMKSFHKHHHVERVSNPRAMAEYCKGYQKGVFKEPQIPPISFYETGITPEAGPVPKEKELVMKALNEGMTAAAIARTYPAYYLANAKKIGEFIEMRNGLERKDRHRIHFLYYTKSGETAKRRLADILDFMYSKYYPDVTPEELMFNTSLVSDISFVANKIGTFMNLIVSDRKGISNTQIEDWPLSQEIQFKHGFDSRTIFPNVIVLVLENEELNSSFDYGKPIKNGFFSQWTCINPTVADIEGHETSSEEDHPPPKRRATKKPLTKKK